MSAASRRPARVKPYEYMRRTTLRYSLRNGS
jgi:hypothetical protein